MNVSELMGEYLLPANVSQSKLSPTIAKITTEGKTVEGKFGKRFEIDVEITGHAYKFRPSKTALRTISSKYGSESALWIGKYISLYAMPIAIGVEERMTIVVCP